MQSENGGHMAGTWRHMAAHGGTWRHMAAHGGTCKCDASLSTLVHQNGLHCDSDVTASQAFDSRNLKFKPSNCDKVFRYSSLFRNLNTMIAERRRLRQEHIRIMIQELSTKSLLFGGRVSLFNSSYGVGSQWGRSGVAVVFFSLIN